MAEPKVKFEDLVPYFGKLPDSDIAKIFGVDRTYIGKIRRKNNIPGFEGQKSPRVKSGNVVEALPWDEIIPQLGVEPDTFLAKKYGCNRSTISRKRVKLNIASVEQITIKPSPVPKIKKKVQPQTKTKAKSRKVIKVPEYDIEKDPKALWAVQRIFEICGINLDEVLD